MDPDTYYVRTIDGRYLPFEGQPRLTEGGQSVDFGYWQTSAKNIRKGSDILQSGGPRLDLVRDNYFHFWPKGQIPYVIDSSMSDQARSYIEEQIERFNNALQYLRAIPRKSQSAYVRFQEYDKCGRAEYGVKPEGGVHNISIGRQCHDNHTVLHELVHAAGLGHTHQRADRDQHVIYRSDNVQSGLDASFAIWSGPSIQILGPYDHRSIMHYGSYQAAKDPSRPAMTLRDGSRISRPQQFTEIGRAHV